MNLNIVCDENAIKMAAFAEKKKCIWHAYYALDEQGTGLVRKNQLKVLTHNIANSLGYSGAEEQLDLYIKPASVTIKDYFDFLQMVVFDAVDLKSASVNFKKVDDVCWMLCATKYRNKDKELLKIRDKDAFKLWQVFNLLTECDDRNELILPLGIDFEEVERLYQKLMTSLGKIWDNKNLSKVRAHSGSEPTNYCPSLCSFQLFLDALEVGYLQDVDGSDISKIIENLHNEMINDVIKMGWLVKKGHIVSSWKERWFVLTPNSCSYYTNEDQREMKGEIPVLSTCRVEPLQDRNVGKPNRFQLVSESRSFEMSTKDLKSKNEWITALQEAIGHTNREASYQKCMFEKRRAERVEKRKLLHEEAQRKQDMEDRLHIQARALEQQKQEIADANARYEEEFALREVEEQRRKELEEMQLQLQKMLEDERQAKKDEEAVRALQEQLLEEEKQTRAELERLKAEQDEVIEKERRKREELEQSHQEQEAVLEKERQIRLEQETILEQERVRLEKLELDRKAADDRLHEATEKLLEAEKAAEKAKQEIEAKKAAKKVITVTRLAQPIQPDVKRLVTHRGQGAFAEEFLKN